jgi:hypothetical protein
MKIIKDIKYSNYDACMLNIYLPNCDSFDVFVYFHGGGLQSGEKEEAHVLAEYLTDKKIAVVSADYRMYPEAKYPNYIEDCAKSVSWVFSNMSQYGKYNNIYIGGSSAGAYISMMLCFDKKYLSAYGIHPCDIKGYIHDSGQPTAHFNILRERGVDTKRIIVDETAPLYHVGTEKEYSNMVFIVSDNDMPNRYEQTMLMQSTLRHFGHYADIKIMHGTHSQYIQEKDGGESVLGAVIFSYIEKWENESKTSVK